jgi:hypothetical protein
MSVSRESTESAEIADVRYKTGTAVLGVDAVEEALAVALDRASAEQRWDVVVLLGRELEARRLARNAKNVVPLRRGVREEGGR